MGFIAQSSIDEVVAASDIVEVIGSYFPLRRAGSTYKALCPFHTEKTPSFSVNPGRQSYHCFGCGASGGVIRFVQEYEHTDFPSAVRRLAEKAGITLQEETGTGDPAERSIRPRLLELHRLVADWFHERLMRSRDAQPARDYLKGRGIDARIAKDWKLGYAPESWDGLLSFAEGEKFSSEELSKSGLFSSKEKGGFYDRFRDRIMFPIHNEFGETIAFSGRILAPKDNTGKYINSPETPIFTKGNVFYGLDKSKRALVEAGEAIVCEGQLDLISAFEAGVQNVIAPQGTAFTPKQARLLKRFASRVVMCFDADEAGLKAVERSLPALLEYDLEVRVATMPPGEDPDSTIRKFGVDEFSGHIRQARDFFDLAVASARAKGNLASPAAVSRLSMRLASLLAHVSDPVYKDRLTEQTARDLGIRPAALRQQMSRPTTRQPEPETEEPTRTIRPVELTRGVRLLAGMAIASSSARNALKRMDLEGIEASSIELELLGALANAEINDDDPAAAGRFINGQPQHLQPILASLEEIPDREDLPAAVEDCLNGMKAQSLQRKIAEAQQRVRSRQLPPSELPTVQKQILDLQRQLADIPRLSRRADAR